MSQSSLPEIISEITPESPPGSFSATPTANNQRPALVDKGMRSVEWRCGAVFLALFGLGFIVVFLHHAEMLSQWADRPLLPRLPFWLVFLTACTLYVRRSLLDRIDRAVPTGVLLLPVAVCLLSFWLPLVIAHAAMLAALVVGMAAWGRWLGIRFILPAVFLLLLLRPLPRAWEMACVDGLLLLQGNLSVWLLSWFVDGTFVLNHDNGIWHHYGLAGWSNVCQIAPECSGYQTLVGGSILAITFASKQSIRWPRKLVLLITAITVAFFGNTLRILISILFLLQEIDTWAKGSTHALLGFAVFGLQLLLLGWIAGFVGSRFQPATQPTKCG